MISYCRIFNCAQELSLFSVYSLTVSASQGLAQVQTGTKSIQYKRGTGQVVVILPVLKFNGTVTLD
jgi:hypothetical protein